MNSTARPNPKASTTPIAESRSRVRCPRKPNSTAARALPTSAPRPTLSPVSKANDAPVRDSSLDPCTAKDICRMTMNGPIAPASSANRAAASRACCTKSRRSRSAVTSKANSCESISVRRSDMVVSARISDHDVLLADLHDLDVGPVELREGRRGHHLGDGADAEAAVDQIEHPVDLVGDEQDRSTCLAAPLVDQRGDQPGVGRVEVEQRFVAQQQGGIGGQ